MNDEANLNKRRRGKTIVAFDSLPELFTFEDVKKAFSASSNNAHVIVCRLKKDLIVEEVEEGKFKKHTMLNITLFQRQLSKKYQLLLL